MVNLSEGDGWTWLPGCGMVWLPGYSVVWYGMVWCGSRGVVWYGIVWYGVVWCGVVWYGCMVEHPSEPFAGCDSVTVVTSHTVTGMVWYYGTMHRGSLPTGSQTGVSDLHPRAIKHNYIRYAAIFH